VARRSLKASVKVLSPDQQAFLEGPSERAPQKARKTEEKRDWVAITVRLRPQVALNLRLAAAKRRVTKRTPYTQEDICQAAVEAWLRTEGSWND
jgi:hypothetical protein